MKSEDNENKIETEDTDHMIVALDEANRYSRHIDNYYWALSSFWIGGNIYMIKIIYDLIKNQKPDVILIAFISLAMLFVWVLFYLFTKNQLAKTEYLYDVINKYEDLLYIDVIPKNVDEFEGKGIGFIKFMKILFWLFVVIWGIVFAINICEASELVFNHK